MSEDKNLDRFARNMQSVVNQSKAAKGNKKFNSNDQEKESEKNIEKKESVKDSSIDKSIMKNKNKKKKEVIKRTYSLTKYHADLLYMMKIKSNEPDKNLADFVKEAIELLWRAEYQE